MDSWWWSSWWVIIAASNCNDFMMKGMVWTLKVMVWWHFVHDIEHKVKSSCSLILVMFGLVLLQLTQWVSSTKCVWWSKIFSWWYRFSLMTLSKIQQFLEFLKRKTGLTALSGFNVQEDHLWHLPPRWQTLHNFWELKFSRMSIWCRRITMSWVLLAMNGLSHQVFTICATLGCFCSGWTWWSSCAVTNVKKKWRKKSKNWMVS